MANTWVTLLAADLESAMTAGEREDFSGADTSEALIDRAEVIVADLVSEIRGMIRSVGGNVLSPDTTLIPPEFKARALAIGRHRLLITVPGYNPGDARKMEYEKADTFFSKVAEGKIRPQNPDDTPPTAGTTVGASGSWNSENKIIGRMNPTPRPGSQNSTGSGDYANPNAPTDHS